MFDKIREFFWKMRQPNVIHIRTEGISGERLYEHLTNLGVDVEIITQGSPEDPVIYKTVLAEEDIRYSSPIKVKGMNFNVIQLNIFDGGEASDYYRLEYIVRGSGMNIWGMWPNLKWGQKSTLKDTLKNARASLDRWNLCVRLEGRGEEVFVTREEYGGFEYVKYMPRKDVEFPTKETLEHYDKRALAVRRLLESEPSQWDQPIWTFVEEAARCGICNADQPFPTSSLTVKAYFPEFGFISGVLLRKDAPPYPSHDMYVCAKCWQRRYE